VGFSLQGGENPVSLFRAEYSSDKSEAEAIARRISALTGGSSFFAIDSGDAAGDGGSRGPPCAPADCAILLRTTGLAPPLLKALEDHGIPWELTGEQPWWEEEPLPALTGELRREPRPELSPPAAVEAAWEELLRREPGLKKFRTPKLPSDPVSKLIALAEYFDGVPALLEAIAVSDPGGVPWLKREGVRIMSIHASKGLEFDHVFVAALEEGLIPFTLYDREGENPGGGDALSRLEEERRLLYVAMTRPRKGLYLSWARSRNFKGRILKNGPSRYLADLESLIPLVKERPLPNRGPQLALF
jgi:superfamily I DNA/RNA helicase